jgi:DNA-binding NarL/FixJ family response regulator
LTMRSSGGRPTAILADDHPAVLAAVRDILQKDYDVLASVTDGVKAVDAVAAYRPDILVLDIAMPGINGLDTASQLRNTGLDVKIVFLTVTEDSDYARAIRNLGASYVVKRRMRVDLVVAMRETLAGRLFPSLVATDLL